MSLAGQEAFAFESLINQQAVDSEFIDFSTYGLTSGDLIYYNDPYLNSVTTGTGLSLTSGILSNTGVTSLTGTANRITVSNSTGNITLSTPQDINTTSSPTFNNLTLNGTLILQQISCLLAADIGGNVLNASTGSSLTYNTTYRTLNTIQDIQTTASPTFAGLTLTGLTGILKATAGTIATNATTDDLTEGSTNLYFTNNRARAAITAAAPIYAISGIISIGYNTSNLKLTLGGNLDTIQDIATSSSPQFARLLNSSIGSTNLLLGSNTGVNLTTGGGNTLIGQGAGSCITTGTYNIGIGPSTFGGLGNMTQNNGFNVAVGVNALYSCSTSAAGNIAIGYQSLANLTTGTTNIQIGNGSVNTLATGSNNVYIGPSISSSSTSVSGEGVINLFGSTAGKGANTMFINASAGLFSYNPVIAQFTFINSNPQIAVNPNFLPYYSYGTSGGGSVPYFNRGITLTTNLNATIGGYWRFQQLGIYKITVSMKQLTQAMSKTTFIGKTPTLGSASITNLGTTSWTTYNNVEYIGWNITTLITVTNLTDYYFITEYFGIAVNSWMNNNASVLIEYVSVG